MRPPGAAPPPRLATHRRTISAIVALATPVVARPYTRRRMFRTRRHPIFLNFYTCRCALRTRRRELWIRRHALPPVVACCIPVIARCATRHRDPSRTLSAPVRASLISTRTFSHFFALCQSIPACTCHGNCLWDSPRGANYFSLHVIHHRH